MKIRAHLINAAPVSILHYPYCQFRRNRKPEVFDKEGHPHQGSSQVRSILQFISRFYGVFEDSAQITSFGSTLVA
jgi:hypothetical protein